MPLLVPLLASEDLGGDSTYWDSVTNVTQSDFVTSSASLVDITGLTFAAVANTKYEVEVYLVGQASNGTGVRTAITFSAAGTTGQFFCVSSLTITTQGSIPEPFGTAAVQNNWTTATTDEFTMMFGIIEIGANAGNITAQIFKNGGGSVTVYKGSSMKIRKL